MNLKCKKLIPAVMLATLAMAGIVDEASANSETFTYTMKFRYVSGKDNKQLHKLDGGELTLSGNLWITGKAFGAMPTPLPITIEVLKDTWSERDVVCTVTVMPETTLNQKREFSKSCGQH